MLAFAHHFTGTIFKPIQPTAGKGTPGKHNRASLNHLGLFKPGNKLACCHSLSQCDSEYDRG